MKSTKKRIIIVFAILTMALVLSCAFVACNKTESDKTGTDKDVCEHVEVTDNAVEPTCTEKGLTEGTHCSKCGKILQAQNEIPALGHTGGTATCTKQAICERCGNKYGELAKHDYQDGVCIVCGNRRPSEGLKYSLNNDGNVYSVTGIGTCTDKELIIPSEYNAKPVTSIGVEAFSGCTGLTSITIPDSVTSIGSQTFRGCTGLTSVTIPDSVTSIGGSAFSGCTGLTSVTIGGSVTSIGERAFYNCTRLTSVTIPDSVTSIGNGAFYNCTGLTTVNWNATTCTSAGSWNYPIFEGCSNLATVNIGDNVKIIPSYAFERCTGLTSITIPNSVTSIGYSAFAGCTGLKSITIPDSVTSIGDDAFYNTLWYNNQPDGLVYAGKVAYKYKGNMPSNTSIVLKEGTLGIAASAFEDCTGLTSVTIPDSVTSIGGRAFYNTAWYDNQPDGLVYAGKVAYKYKGTMPSNTSIVLREGTLGIAGGAFGGCTGLTNVTIPDSVTSIGAGAFAGCTELTSITVAKGNTKYHSAENCLIETESKTLIAGCKNSIIPSDGSVTSIGYEAFSYCTGLTSITIPDSVTSIGDGAFYNCTGLTSVTIGNSVISIDSGAFSGCTGLTSITIPNSVTSIGEDAFRGCNKLTSITIPDSVTSIGAGAFAGCTELTSVTIGNSVTNIGDYAFSRCTGLKNVTIPDSVTSIGDSAFYNTAWYKNQPNGLVYAGKVAYKYKGTMPSNTSIVLREGTLGITDYAFYGCTGLTSVTIPDSVTSIGYKAFYGCTGLTSVTIPDSVTSIGREAFYGCTGLTSVTIGKGVTSFGSDAFRGCDKLQDIYITDIVAWCNISGLDNLMYNGASNKKLYINNELATSITIPNGVTAIPSYAFHFCTGLTSVTIPDSVTSIGWGAFSGCTGLTSITIPDSVTSIGSYAFYNTAWYKNQSDGLVYAGKVACTYKGTMPSNTSIVLREGTLGIAGSAFENFKGLTSVTIPDSVTSISYDAFYGCTGLTNIKFNGTIKQWNAISKGYYWKYSVPATQVVCRDGTISI